MGSDPNLDVDNFKKFLQEFTSNHAGTDDLPFASLSCRLTKDEIEGECLEWVTNCLIGQNEAPAILACALARATVDTILSKDLSVFAVDDEVGYGEEGDIACTLYDAGQIFPLVWSTLNDLCQLWTTDMPELSLPKSLHPISHHAIKNTRKRMEDKHVIIPDLNTLFHIENEKPRSFYAVFDGHGGTDAAIYACQHLHGNALRQDCFPDDPAKALAKSFHVTDQGFLKKARREGLGSGTTGVAAIIEPDKLHLSWLGDSQAFLMRDGQPVTLMEPHKPERQDEKQRIEQLGGCVLFFGVWRVNGTLAVSRAIGDPDQKPYVSSDADMITMPLNGTEDCLIIACDGLWDVVEPQDVCRAIQQSINNDDNLSTMSNRLVSLAKSSGSNDNITVLVIFLNPKERDVPETADDTVLEEGEPTKEDEDTRDDDHHDEQHDDHHDEQPDQEVVSEVGLDGGNDQQSGDTLTEPTDEHSKYGDQDMKPDQEMVSGLGSDSSNSQQSGETLPEPTTESNQDTEEDQEMVSEVGLETVGSQESGEAMSETGINSNNNNCAHIPRINTSKPRVKSKPVRDLKWNNNSHAVAQNQINGYVLAPRT